MPAHLSIHNAASIACTLVDFLCTTSSDSVVGLRVAFYALTLLLDLTWRVKGATACIGTFLIVCGRDSPRT
ncbi:hypothetical protein KC319_g18 [Hortaea werneckii]|nr:hypothetical protein KC319_g18 [Hortaea werneckii]